MGKKLSFLKNTLPFIKCVLRLFCVVHGPIYGRFMDCTVNDFLSIHKGYKERRPFTVQPINWPMDHTGET